MPLLWPQAKVSNREIAVSKVPGSENPADLATKALDNAMLHKHLAGCGFVFVEAPWHYKQRCEDSRQNVLTVGPELPQNAVAAGRGTSVQELWARLWH
eukprot:3498152-Amphidinium_carterae.1